MKTLATDRSAIFKIIVIAAFAATFISLWLVGTRQRAAASAFGPSPVFTNAPGESNCTACHADFALNSGTGSVEITGVPANYAPGQTYTLTVRATQIDAVIYGFQLTAIDPSGNKAGAFDIPLQSEGRIQILQGVVGQSTIREYIEHTSGGLSNGQFGYNSWVFTWTAPQQSVGRVDFYAAGNSANSDGGTGGDYIYTDMAFSMPATSFVSVSGRVTSPAGLNLRSTKVLLTDSAGAQISALTSSFGIYSFSSVPAGSAYTVSVQSKRYRFTPRSIAPTENVSNIDFVGLE